MDVKKMVLASLAFGSALLSIHSEVAAEWSTLTEDPGFNDHPLVDRGMGAAIAPYLLPYDHPSRTILDFIFSQSRVLENERTLIEAGFIPIAGPMPNSFMMVARHWSLPNYVFKFYFDSEARCRKNIPHWKWLLRRCIGARGIQHIIEKEHIRHFVVPEKWLYILPKYPYSQGVNPQAIILVATDMEPESQEVSARMWKESVTRQHLDELYAILKHGYGGHGVVNLDVNVPFTKQGKFAFTDTEDPRADLKLKRIKKYLSKEMRHYWEALITPSRT